MQFFIHCNLFCQEYKFTYLLYLVLLTRTNNHLVSKRNKVWLVWLKSGEFVYKLSSCRFDSSCSHLLLKVNIES